MDDLLKEAISKDRCRIPQSRKGRRPISVEKYLQKDKEGTLFKKHAASDSPLMALIAASSPPTAGTRAGDVPSVETAKGTNVEENTSLRGYSFPLLKDAAVHRGFYEELAWLSKQAVDQEAWDALSDMEKEAAIGNLLKSVGAQASALGAKISPNMRMMQAAKANGLGDVAQKAMTASSPANRMAAFGKNMAMTPAARVGAVGAEAGQINKTVGRMGATSAPKRIMGGAIEGTGHHVAHKSALGLLTNPLGVPLGGAIEGATRQGGKELASAGHARSGAFMQRHAGKAGLAGEIAGMAGLGTMAAAPLSGAGALGTAALKGIGMKGPLINALGQYGAHGVADAAGTAMQGGAKALAGKFMIGKAAIGHGVAKHASDEEALAAYQRLQRLESMKQSKGEIFRGAVAGTGLGVLGNLINTSITGKRATGVGGLARQVAGAAVPGMLVGAALPAMKQKMNTDAEKEKIRANLGVSDVGKTRSAVRQTLGVG